MEPCTRVTNYNFPKNYPFTFHLEISLKVSNTFLGSLTLTLYFSTLFLGRFFGCFYPRFSGILFGPILWGKGLHPFGEGHSRKFLLLNFGGFFSPIFFMPVNFSWGPILHRGNKRYSVWGEIFLNFGAQMFPKKFGPFVCGFGQFPQFYSGFGGIKGFSKNFLFWALLASWGRGLLNNFPQGLKLGGGKKILFQKRGLLTSDKRVLQPF